MAVVDLTPDEANVALGGLYERLNETKRYLNTARSIVDQHHGHGKQCCARGLVDRERESQGYLEVRLAAIQSAISKIEALPEEPA